ncbi:Gfo/Idh/MocA family protein [Streptomyces albipurpureus]|uniref:Gfo/Idh/MocA family oxidoreductase n=1 Tax=Streptomyces albipurpureus TaxID=2897419 RepID=A0ABT0UTG4_9ACTN|nr:Gfo/Idh/MocA family oxidoreductase [Streptomyces sp. CWNU-1]MCM2391887.1 Gfo/Idh/MocA family oxidoreductase [Streptomyces sp. CWNU-1]
MKTDTLGVAVVGAGADHWSGAAHIPAITALNDVRLKGLVTSSPESASAATARWGVPATHDLDRVLDDKDVDIVAVTVRVPRHAEIVKAAIGAGKHIYCEWPLATGSGQARELAELSAAHPEQVHVTGLQGRYSPHLGTAAALLSSGRVGRPLSANLRLHLPHGLLPRPAHRAHLRHRSVGANVLTIQAGHTLDMLGVILGRPRVDSARLWSAVPEFLVDTGERLPRDAPDSLITVLDHAGVVTVAHISQTGPRETFALEILGTEGALSLTGTSQPQFGGLTLAITPLGGTSEEIAPHDGLPYPSPLPASHPGHNVASAYAALTAAVRDGHRDSLIPDFQAAVDLHVLLEEIERTAAGKR